MKEITALLKEITKHLKGMAGELKGVTIQLNETNSILKDFMGASVKYRQKQEAVNETIIKELKEIKGLLPSLARLDERLTAVEERGDKFESRLTNIERMLKAS